MSRTAQTLAFGTCHTIVPLISFVGTILLTMLSVQPVVVVLSLVGALVFSLLVRGPRATLKGFVWQLPMMALVCLANPLFSGQGSTLVCKVFSLSVYWESLVFGACMGALLVAMVLWLEGAARVLVQDRLLALVGRRARAVPLVISMATQLVPQLVARGEEVRAATQACTAAGSKGTLRSDLVRTSSVVMSWAMEDSLERADSMRARGWESGSARTAYRPEVLRSSDAAWATLVAVLVGVSAWLLYVACSQWHFYPTMPTLRLWWGYVPFAVLVAIPSVLEVAGRAREVLTR